MAWELVWRDQRAVPLSVLACVSFLEAAAVCRGCRPAQAWSQSDHMHKTGTEPGYMAGIDADAIRGSTAGLILCSRASRTG